MPLSRRALHAASLAAPVASLASLTASRLARAARLPTVRLTPGDRRVDVTVAGAPFTTYAWVTAAKKPILFPILSPGGHRVTRGFPLDPRPGERADHPHHTGLWFNYGDVDGIDFWGHSEATAATHPEKLGTIVHDGLGRITHRGGRGELEATALWVRPGGAAMLREQITFAFEASARRRVIDRVTTLTAAAGPVTFKDNKEGLFAVRVARELELPSRPGERSPVVLPDGKIGSSPSPLDPGRATGAYTSSEAQTGDAVWGTRGRWMMLTGRVGGKSDTKAGTKPGAAGEDVTLAILDHPANPGYPTYWHARGYGLFAANPLGQAVFSKGKETLAFRIPAGRSARFAYRLLVLQGHARPADIEAEHARFARSLPATVPNSSP